MSFGAQTYQACIFCIPPCRPHGACRYNESDVTHFGQVLEHCRVGVCWAEVKRTSAYEERLAQVRG